MSLDRTIAERQFHNREAEWVPPTRYKLDGTDNDALEELLAANSDLIVIDPIDDIADDLFELHHTEQMDDPNARAEYREKIKDQGLSYGEFVHIPWNRTVVRYPDQVDHRRLRVFRNLGLDTEEDQATYSRATLAAFGLSVGSNIVDQTLQSGVGETYIVGDFDRLSVPNLNRISARMGQVGLLKTIVAGRKIGEADPYITQHHLEGGYTDEADALMDRIRPDAIVEEVDNLGAKVRVRDYAQKNGIPLVMAIDLGEKSILHVERHDLEDVKLLNGRVSEDVLERIRTGQASSKDETEAHIQIAGMRNVLSQPRLIRSHMEVGRTLAGLPQLGSVASEGAVLADRAIREILAGRRMDSGVYVAPTARETLKGQRLMSLGQHVRTVIDLASAMKK